MGLALQIFQAIFAWKVDLASEAELRSADVILAHECGGNLKGLSWATSAIARNALALHKRFRKPVIFQHPCQTAVPELEPAAVISKHHLQGRYIDTDEVQRQVAEICQAHGWTRVILSTNPWHEWRAGRNLIRHGLTPVYADNSNVRCDIRMWRSRPHLSSKVILVPYEAVAKFIYFRRGLI